MAYILPHNMSHAHATNRETVHSQLVGLNSIPADESLAAPEGQLLAAILSARISEPKQVRTVLQELRLESTVHLGQLDLEERYEMMAAMRGAGVALGSRNKLRLLASESERTVLLDHRQGFRRAQAEESNIDPQADVRRDSATTQARERASEQSGEAKQESNRILGVSGDSAPYMQLMSR
jgi:hypothetical protein